ncbi:hypothetical protein IWX49DRAFT_45280 [Phyllosticta citricarpa]
MILPLFVAVRRAGEAVDGDRAAEHRPRAGTGRRRISVSSPSLLQERSGESAEPRKWLVRTKVGWSQRQAIRSSGTLAMLHGSLSRAVRARSNESRSRYLVFSQVSFLRAINHHKCRRCGSRNGLIGTCAIGRRLSERPCWRPGSRIEPSLKRIRNSVNCRWSHAKLLTFLTAGFRPPSRQSQRSAVCPSRSRVVAEWWWWWW